MADPTLGDPVDYNPFATGDPSLGQPVQGNPFAAVGQPAEGSSWLPDFPAAIRTGGQAAIDAAVAGAQGTSPIVAGGGQMNYQLAPESAQWRYRELEGTPGAVQPGEVALRDPTTGQMKLYLRNPEMEEGRAAGVGRMLAQGAVPEGGIFGPTAAGARAAPILQDFSRVGANPTIPVVSGGPAAGYATSIMGKLPGFSGPIVRGAQRLSAQGGEALERFAGAEPYTAPELVDSFTTKSGNLYDQFWSKMDQSKQVSLPNTLDALKGPIERFPTVPELGEAITDPTLKRYYDIISNAGGTMTAPELSEFRSFLGRKMGAPPAVNDIPRADLANVYRALSNDLRNEADATSPAARSAFDQATSYYWAGRNRIDKLEPILNQTTPTATMNGLNKNIDTLEEIGSQMPADEWKGVGAAVLRRMGEGPVAAKDVEQVQAQAPTFSPTAFATNYVRLGDRAKDALFGAVGTEQRDNIDALARVAGRAKGLAQFTNPSGTAHTLAAGAEAVSAPILAYEYGDKLLEHPIYTSLAMLGGYAAPRLLMSPGFTRWLYNLPYAMNRADTPAQGAIRALSSLDTLARSDPDVLTFTQQMRDVLNTRFLDPNSVPPVVRRNIPPILNTQLPSGP